jgi:saccharopine dehydrogenase (NAD+, L-lysine-forming)
VDNTASLAGFESLLKKANHMAKVRGGGNITGKRILILGGYGNTGRPLAECLLQETDAHVVIAGRSIEKARGLAQHLNTKFEGQRVAGLSVDASDQAGLRAAFSQVDVVVVVASTSALVKQVATAALEAGIDYLDVQYSAHKMAVLQAMASHIEAAGCCFITDGGFHPGLPAALVRYVAPCFDVLESARVGSVIKINWSGLDVGQATMVEFIGEFMDFQMLDFHHGRWQQAGLMAMLKPVTMDFGREFGRQYAMPMFLEEMRAIPELVPGIRETGFYVGSFNWFTDWFVSPLVMLGLKLAPRRGLAPLARLFRWSLNAFSRPPYGTMLKVEARGQKDGQAKAIDLTLYHPDGYVFTAVPVAATLLQLLDGSARKPGLHLQAHIVEPQRLMRDLARLGIKINK